MLIQINSPFFFNFGVIINKSMYICKFYYSECVYSFIYESFIYLYLSHFWSSMSVAFLCLPAVLFIVNDVWLSTHPWRDPFFTAVDLLTLFYTRMLDSESLLNSTFGQTCTHAHPTEHSTSCKGINDECESPAHSGVFWCFSVFSHCSEFCPLGSVVAWVIAEDRAQLGLLSAVDLGSCTWAPASDHLSCLTCRVAATFPGKVLSFLSLDPCSGTSPHKNIDFWVLFYPVFPPSGVPCVFPFFCTQYRVVLCLSELPRVCIWILQERLHNNKSIQLDIRFNHVNHMI